MQVVAVHTGPVVPAQQPPVLQVRQRFDQLTLAGELPLLAADEQRAQRVKSGRHAKGGDHVQGVRCVLTQPRQGHLQDVRLDLRQRQ